MSEPSLDDRTCLELVARADYRELFEYVSPFLQSGLEHDRALLGLPGSDHIENVMLGLAAKLLRRDGHKLATSLAWLREHPDKTFLDWLRIVRRNAVNDYMEACLRKGKTSRADGNRLRELVGAVDEVFGHHQPRFTKYLLVGRIMEYVNTSLPTEQQRALELWLQGYGFGDIGGKLGCTPDDAERFVDAAKARLKRQFANERDE